MTTFLEDYIEFLLDVGEALWAFRVMFITVILVIAFIAISVSVLPMGIAFVLSMFVGVLSSFAAIVWTVREMDK